MAKVIFIGGMRGVGKTTILNNLKKVKKTKLVDIILKSRSSWRITQKMVGKKIKDLALKEKIIVVDLHYGVPKEALIEERKKQNVNFSGDFEQSLTKLMLKNMKDGRIKFYFCYIDVKIDNIIKRLEGSKKLSDNFLRNMARIKKLDRTAFIEIFNTAKKLNLNVNKKIIDNNRCLRKTIKNLEKIIWK
jgi:thymidylate kinase